MDSNRLNQVWQNWRIVEVLGEGSFGKVYKAVRDEHGVITTAAIKTISIPQNESELASLRSEGLDDNSVKAYFKDIADDFAKEIKLMDTMKGTTNIVSVDDFAVLEKSDGIGWDIFIRMELLTGFVDYTANKKLREPEVIKLGEDILSALELCAQRNIIHRDIKPENIFVSEFGYYKLGDFGIARELEKTAGNMSHKGTHNYMAPEIAAGKPYDSTVDTYSLGLVLYRLLNNNRLPFLDMAQTSIKYQDRKDAIDRRLSGEPLPRPAEASEAMARVIAKACSFNPADRYHSPSEFKTALEAIKANSSENVQEEPFNETLKLPENMTETSPNAKKSPSNTSNAPVNNVEIPGANRGVIRKSNNSLWKTIVAFMCTAVLFAGLVIGLNIYRSDNRDIFIPEDRIDAGELIQFSGETWRVLDIKGNKALLLSEDILASEPYHKKKGDITWKDSSIRKYLKDDFYNDSFTDEEKERIVYTTLKNNDNQWYDTYGGDDTKDKIFLLSLEEAVEYFGDSGKLNDKQTEGWVDDEYNKNRKSVGKGTGAESWWWLRSPGGNSGYAAGVREDGTLSFGGGNAADAGGVRPALWLRIDNPGKKRKKQEKTSEPAESTKPAESTGKQSESTRGTESTSESGTTPRSPETDSAEPPARSRRESEI